MDSEKNNQSSTPLDNHVSNRVKHEAILKVENVSKVFDLVSRKVQAISEINLEVYAKDFLVIYGPSGCGKSTLLNIMCGIDEPTSGKVSIRGKNITKMSEDERGIFRSQKMGVIYQMPMWIKSLNVLENVMMPLMIEGEKERKAKEKSHQILEELHLTKLEKQLPIQLSGGEQQKIALARSLITNPWIVVADEPTGNLDTHSADQLVNILQTLNQEKNRTIIMVTHNLTYLPLATRTVAMSDGRIVREEDRG